MITNIIWNIKFNDSMKNRTIKFIRDNYWKFFISFYWKMNSIKIIYQFNKFICITNIIWNIDSKDFSNKRTINFIRVNNWNYFTNFYWNINLTKFINNSGNQFDHQYHLKYTIQWFYQKNRTIKYIRVNNFKYFTIFATETSTESTLFIISRSTIWSSTKSEILTSKISSTKEKSGSFVSTPEKILPIWTEKSTQPKL